MKKLKKISIPLQNKNLSCNDRYTHGLMLHDEFDYAPEEYRKTGTTF